MITLPDRLAALRERLAAGEPIDWRTEHDLLALDLVIAGEQYVAEALGRQEGADGQIPGHPTGR